jgi:hypothetical protein
MTAFRQCKFQHNNSFTIGWILAKHAKVGNRFALTNVGYPELAEKRLWKIIAAYEPTKDLWIEGIDYFTEVESKRKNEEQEP